MKKLVEFAEKYDMLPQGGLVVAAVSGGADSMCLLHALEALGKERGFKVAAAHFNHNLRGAESDRDAAFVEEYCSKHGIDFYTDSGDVNAFAGENGMGIEEAARALRYGFFQDLATRLSAGAVAMAHTADDNVETVIMNLTRGAGLRGLSGIPAKRDIFIRPMLGVTRREVEEYLEANGVPHITDSSNEEDIYTRNRIRRHVIPVLKDINPGLCDAVSAMTELVAEDEAFLHGLAVNFTDKNYTGGRLPVTGILALPLPVSRRVFREISPRALSAGHVEDILRLCRGHDPSAELSLPGMKVSREYGDLVFGEPAYGTFEEKILKIGTCIEINELNKRFFLKKYKFTGNVHKTFNTFIFKKDGICGNISVRPKKSGDNIRFAGSNMTKSLKKLFIEKKIPAAYRGMIPVIADDAGVLVLPGMGAAERPAPKDGDDVIEIVVEEIG